LYDRTVRNQTISPETITDIHDGRITDGLNDYQLEDFYTNIELLDELGMDFDYEAFRRGEQTPVYFGSALTNFGVQLFLDDFVQFAPAPGAYPTDSKTIEPVDHAFSGFVFKIQANMNPRHRDSVAFVRICSGRFERNMTVNHARTGKTIRLPVPYTFFADQRQVVEEAYAGDIIGLPGNRNFNIGDTISVEKGFAFAPIPRFAAEHFARIINLDISKQKQFLKGIHQLETEGAMQVLYETDAQRRDPILAVVGVLQFEVVQARLENEYNVKVRLEMLPHQLCRFVVGSPEQIEQLPWRFSGMMKTQDADGRLIGLFNSKHEFNYYKGKYPDIQFNEIS
jgi:peptide chain release factor 3